MIKIFLKAVFVLSLLVYMVSGSMFDSELYFEEILRSVVLSFLSMCLSGYLLVKGEKHGTNRRRA